MAARCVAASSVLPSPVTSTASMATDRTGRAAPSACVKKVVTSRAPLPRPQCPAIASHPMDRNMRKVRAGMMDVATATAIPDGRCACSYPAQCPAVFILLSSLTSVALPVRTTLAAVSLRGWTWWCAEHLGESFMWRGRPGTWTNARAAPAGRDVSCVTPKCVPQLFAKRRSGTRTPAAMYAQKRRPSCQ